MYQLSEYQYYLLYTAANTIRPYVAIPVPGLGDSPDSRAWWSFCLSEMRDLVTLGLFGQSGSPHGFYRFIITPAGFDLFNSAAQRPVQ